MDTAGDPGDSEEILRTTLGIPGNPLTTVDGALQSDLQPVDDVEETPLRKLRTSAGSPAEKLDRSEEERPTRRRLVRKDSPGPQKLG